VRWWSEGDNVSTARQMWEKVSGDFLTADVKTRAVIESIDSIIEGLELLAGGMDENVDQNLQYQISAVNGTLPKFVTIQYVDERGVEDDFIKLQLHATPSLFLDHNGVFTRAVESEKFENREFWSRAFQTSAARIKDEGKAPFYLVMSLFSEHLDGLALTEDDKVLYLAGALRNWTGNALVGVEMTRDFVVDEKYGKLHVIREYADRLPNYGSNWMFIGGHCNTISCVDLYRFLSLSRDRFIKDEALEYIRDEGFNLHLPDADDPVIVGRDEYLSNFLVDGSFETKDYDFEQNIILAKYVYEKLVITYDGETFEDGKITIHLPFDRENQKYYISDIFIEP
jgi:hypothetical protein